MTDNIALLAPQRQASHTEQLMRWAIGDTLRYLTEGRRDRALVRITSSVLGEQARAAGIRVST